MCRKLICFILVLGLTGVVEAAGFSDNFDTDWNYLAQGKGAYDGILNGTLEALDANMSRTGSLYMQSIGGVWDGATTSPSLYVNWTGDFVATVKVTDFAGTLEESVFHNDCGITARDPDGDPNQNWVSMNYFPTWTAFVARSTVDNVRGEYGQTAARWSGDDTYAIAEAYPWIQLERRGDDFYFRVSANGAYFLPLTDPAYQGIYNPDNDPCLYVPLVISRPDLPETLQIGLMQCTYDSTVSGYAAFDNFSIVPEPATIALLGLGGLALIRRKRA